MIKSKKVTAPVSHDIGHGYIQKWIIMNDQVWMIMNDQYWDHYGWVKVNTSQEFWEFRFQFPLLWRVEAEELRLLNQSHGSLYSPYFSSIIFGDFANTSISVEDVQWSCSWLPHRKSGCPICGGCLNPRSGGLPCSIGLASMGERCWLISLGEVTYIGWWCIEISSIFSWYIMIFESIHRT